MKNIVLKLFLWLLGTIIIAGNVTVLVFHVKKPLKKGNKRESQRVSSFLLANLAVADLLMGIYMLLLGGADIYFSETFYLNSKEWRSSSVCRGANFLVVLSCEASLFLLMIITFDRYHRCVYPFSLKHMKMTKCLFIVLSIWLVTFAIALLSSILASSKNDFYGLTDVCIGLPFITRPSNFRDEVKDLSVFQGQETSQTLTVEVSSGFKLSWYFSLMLFTGVNFFVCLAIAICYMSIFVAARQSSKAANSLSDLQKDLTMASHMLVIVGTNYICWLPVIIMGVLSQFGVRIPLILYAWTVVFILPINSTINPFLYTLAVLISNKISVKHLKRK